MAVAITALIMAITAFLGFYASTGLYLPRHFDKILHFLGFGSMAYSTFWIVTVPDGDDLTPRYWHYLPLAVSGCVWLSACQNDGTWHLHGPTDLVWSCTGQS
jgi:hypothetical protein